MDLRFRYPFPPLQVREKEPVDDIASPVRVYECYVTAKAKEDEAVLERGLTS